MTDLYAEGWRINKCPLWELDCPYRDEEEFCKLDNPSKDCDDWLYYYEGGGDSEG